MKSQSYPEEFFVSLDDLESYFFFPSFFLFLTGKWRKRNTLSYLFYKMLVSIDVEESLQTL